MSKASLPPDVKKYLSAIASKGGKAGTGAAKARTPELASKASNVRWAKYREQAAKSSGRPQKQG